jgi:ABC-type dipeptide/oligopeptide/nickel transport system ATPase subunit
MKICHLADIQIRFGSRHNEYRAVFKKLHEDLAKLKPDRIVVAGDINHHKINISPGSFELFSELLIGLARIAPTDIIIGNHDLNLQQLEQGDSIGPIFSLSNLIQESDKKVAYIVSGDNKDSLDFNQKAIYFFPDSGFYNLSDDLIYGVYSMKDNKILTLEKKEPGVNYVALYHGQMYGARGDNGHTLQGDNLIKENTFNNFDIVMLGDIHEYQTFREDESMAYCGSLIQQNYGESVDKGYIIWDVEKRTHERKYIPNDFGFAKITIAKGEKFEERIEHIKFSSNKKKTKVYVVWEDYEENFSQEKENQIIKLVKDRHGCEIVKVQFETIIKDVIVTEGEEEVFKESEEYLKEFISDGNYDCTAEELGDLIALHRETNEKLEIVEGEDVSSEWKLNKVEISNIFSFPVKPTTIDFDFKQGITGIFGENYNGKSNVIKAMVWGLYKEILGGGDPRFVTNIYTDSNKGYVKFWITIDGQKFYIERSVKTTKKKDGTTSNSYSIIYKKLEFEYDAEGNLDSEKWENEQSDEKTAEKNEVSKLVENAIGTFDDFTKTSLQTQGGKDDYLSMSQQPKNSLVSKYLGLESYKLRYEYRKDFFNEIKKKQKELGDKLQIELNIKEMESNKDIKSKEYDNAVSEKEKANTSREKTDGDILELTKKLEKVETVIVSDPAIVNHSIKQNESEIETINKDIERLASWLSINFKKELPFDNSVTIEQLETSVVKETSLLNKDVEEHNNIEDWLKNNPSKKEIPIDGIEGEIDDLKLKVSQLEGLIDTFKGKKCQMCGHVHEKSNPHKEEECLEEIKIKKALLKHKQDKVRENSEASSHNTKRQNNVSRYEILKQSIINKKEKIQSLNEKIDLINKSQDIVKHNQLVETNSANFSRAKSRVDFLHKNIDSLKEDLVKIKNNEDKIKNNKITQDKIDTFTELSKAYKLSVYNLDKQVTSLFGDIKVIENNIKNYSQKLIDITQFEKMYKKYSTYLQAMHKDGIPALIIRKKLPLINHRINTILQQAVNFKINMDILANGDIVETFYFSDDKSDTLPLSFASGAQKFVSSIAIKDALHYISSLTKPSLCIIDEGFGTLDDKLTFEITNILTYLKNKHKNVIVITHRNEIKDFADNIIEVLKVKQGLTQEVIDANPEAGVTKLNII